MSGLAGDTVTVRGVTILVVDEDREIRSSMKRSLEKLGYRVVKAEDVQEMIEAGQREHPDLIMTNTDLPWLDHLIRRLEEDNQLRFLPIVAIYPDSRKGCGTNA